LNARPPSLLVVDDKRDLAQGVALVLEDLSGDIRVVHSGDDALAAMRGRAADLVLSDIRMPGMDGLALLGRLREGWPHARVILFTGYATVDSAVEAMKQGAYHYLTKPFDNDELLLICQRAVRELANEDELRILRAALAGRETLCGMASRDRQMLALFDAIRKVAPSKAAVLIRGESGVGKELVARAVHELSARDKGPFVAFNAAAVPESLAEAELFGVKKGAFTGAQQDRKGHFATAHGGTLFIDELASMPLALQGKLLRALQEGEIQPVGSDRVRSVDVRVVSAMNQDPAALVREGRLRQDLYYRLAVVTLRIPPLRDRLDDVRVLSELFISQLGGGPKDLSPDALRVLLGHTWPGNVRELRNVIERALLLSTSDVITAGEVVLEGESIDLAPSMGELLPYELAKREAVERFQRRYVTDLLERHGHNISASAHAAGMTRAALHRIINRLEIGESEG